MDFPDPAWVTNAPAQQREAKRRRFQIYLAAVYASEDCDINTFAQQAGLNPTRLHSIAKCRNPPVTALEAVALEKVCGPEILSRATLMPWFFLPPTP